MYVCERIRAIAHVCTLYLQLKVFVCKFVAIDRFATSSVVIGEITSLAHEVGDDTMERRTLEAETLLACAKAAEILSGLRDNIRTQSHGDAAKRLSAR